MLVATSDDSAASVPAQRLVQHHVLMVIGNLAIDAAGVLCVRERDRQRKRVSERVGAYIARAHACILLMLPLLVLAAYAQKQTQDAR